MSTPATDHRRVIAERNVEAILEAAERLLAAGATLSIVALAAEAGVSRPTFYAHFSSVSDVVEATVVRAVAAAVAAVRSADPGEGPADVALERLLDACWMHLARQDALARASAAHVPSERLHRAHGELLSLVQELLSRGQREGAFRDDLPTAWLATTLYALLHAADDHARAGHADRSEALAMLKTSVGDLFARR